jgi:hypothetical protein
VRGEYVLNSIGIGFITRCIGYCSMSKGRIEFDLAKNKKMKRLTLLNAD